MKYDANRKNAATDKSYTLRKMIWKFQNFKSDISYKIAFHIFFVVNWNSLELRAKWSTSIRGWIRLYASVSSKTKAIHKFVSRNSTISIPIKSVCDFMYITIIYKSIFYKETSHWWFTSKIDNFVWKYAWYISDLLFFFFLSDNNIWSWFLYFVVSLIVVAFHAQIFFNCSNSLWWMSL